MAFADPSSGFFSPNMPSAGPVDIPTARMQPLPSLDNINSPRAQPFEMIRPIQYQADKTVGVAIAGAGDILGNSVAGIDNALKTNAVKEVRSGMDALLNRQIAAGLETKQDLLEQQSESKKTLNEAPSGLGQGLSRLETIQKAARNGSISDTQFMAQASDIVSGLKTRYPGYGAIISDAAERLYGVSAEKQRASIQRDIDAIRRTQIEKMDAYDKHILANEKYLPSNYRERTREANLKDIHAGKSEELQTERDAAKIKAQVDNGIAPWQQASTNFNWKATMSSKKGIESFDENLARQGISVEKALMGQLDPQQLETVTVALTALQTEWKRSMYLYAATNTFDPQNPGMTVSNILRNSGKGDHIDKIVQEADQYQRILDALHNKQNGVAGAEIRMAKSIESSVEARMWADPKNAALVRYSVLAGKLGSVFPEVIKLHPQVIKPLASAIALISQKKNLTGGSDFSDTIKETDGMYGAEGEKTPTLVTKQLVDNKLTVLSNEIPDKQYQQTMFRDVYLDKSNTFLISGIAKSNGGINSATDVFNRFISPEITQRVFSSMPEDIKQGYTNWAKDNFSKIVPGLSEDVAARSSQSPFFNVIYDKASSQYITVPTELGKKQPNQYREAVNNGNRGQSLESMKKLNSSLQSLKPIIEATGQDFNDYVSQQPFAAYLNPEGAAMKKGGYWHDTAKNKSDKNLNQSTTPSDPLKSLLRKGEASGSYDIMFGDKNFKATGMTVGEVIAEQKARIKGGAKSVAVGGYQFINETLERMVKKTGISSNAMFTQEVQDQLADAQLEELGLSDYKAGKITKSAFINKLSGVWAALPNTSGKGTHDGDGLNKANIKLDDLIDTLDLVR